MLIGNRERFALEISPVSPSWEPRYEPEAAAWAGLSIWVWGKNLCAHARAGEEELRMALFVPLGPVADWFVRAYSGIAFEERPPWLETKTRRLHEVVRKWGESPPPVGLDEESWLDDREAFWSRHFLLAGADGAWLPNLCLLREDDEVTLTWREPPFRSDSRMTFLNAEGSARVAWTEVQAVLERFVEEVAKAFEQHKLAPYPWIKAASPRLRFAASGSEAVALYCARPLRQVAELLGVQPEQVLTMLGKEVACDPAVNALCQVFRDLPPCPSSGMGAQARATLDTSVTITTSSGLASWAEARALALDAARAAETAEQAGQFAASAVRRELALDGQPIDSTGDVLASMGLVSRSSVAEAEYEHMLVVAAQRRAPAVTILRTVQTRRRWGHRFEEARALGHALLDPLRGEVLGAAATRWTQSVRRRRSGAFAAELLLPESALVEASGGHLDGVYADQTFTKLIERYGVGAVTAAWQLYNHKLVSPQVRDQLIERYAAYGD